MVKMRLPPANYCPLVRIYAHVSLSGNGMENEMTSQMTGYQLTLALLGSEEEARFARRILFVPYHDSTWCRPSVVA